MMFFLANWQRILIAVGILGALGWIGWDRWKLDYYEAWTHHYEAVQRQNGEAIAAQNRAIRLLWLRQKEVAEREKKAQFASAKIMAKALVESRKPVNFTQKATCDQDVEEIFQKVRGLK